jgi:hypothetical protein
MHPLEAIFAYAQRAGVAAISQLPGCWEVDVNGRWWFARSLCGRQRGHATDQACSRGPSVLPFGCSIEYQGWPAAVLDALATAERPCVGEFAAGEAANAAACVTALEAKQ